MGIYYVFFLIIFFFCLYRIFNFIYNKFCQHLFFFNTNDETNVPVIDTDINPPPPNYIVSNTDILPPAYTP